jgi:hypothetical protein
MNATTRLLACALIALAALSVSACGSEGIGLGVPSSGARWGGGSSGPGVLVGGGPVY